MKDKMEENNMFPSVLDNWKKTIKEDIDKAKTSEELRETLENAKGLEEKPKVIILDDNPVSIANYAEEFPENWKKICEALDKEKKEKTLMVCMVCGREDETRSAYCSRCGRTPHRMMTKEEQNKFKKFIGELTIC